jgi:hypothetical protein
MYCSKRFMVMLERWCVEHCIVSSMATAITQPLDAESPLMEIFINVKLETIDDAGVSKHCGGGCDGHNNVISVEED